MDEATSNLDAETEAQVESAIARLMEGGTTLIVAHRLFTVVRANQIAVLSNGEIIEQCTHDELLAGGGPHARLLATQTRNTRARTPLTAAAVLAAVPATTLHWTPSRPRRPNTRETNLWRSAADVPLFPKRDRCRRTQKSHPKGQSPTRRLCDSATGFPNR